MAFSSTTISRASNSSDAPAKSFFAIKRDQLLTVTGYDTERHLIFGFTQDKKYVEAHVSPQDVSKQRTYYGKSQELSDKAEKAPYLSHEINAKMESIIIPDGTQRAILHGAEVKKKINKTIQTVLGTVTEFRQVECQKVTNAGNNPEKTFEALITITKNHRFNKVDRVQVWNPEAFSVNDQPSLEALAGDFERFSQQSIENAKAAENKSTSTPFYLPSTGAELRVIKLSDNPVEGGKIIDTSGRIERTNAVYAADNTTIVTPSQPCTREAFLSNVKEYVDYVKTTYGENVTIEVSHYQSYPTNAKSNEFDFSMMTSSFSPIIQMAHAQSKIAADDTNYSEGGNYGGWGVVSLSKDRTIEGSTDVIQSNFVNSIAVSTNTRSFVHKKITSSNGQKYDLSEDLKGTVLKYNSTPARTNTLPTAPSRPQAQHQNYANEKDIPFHALPKSRPTAGRSEQFNNADDIPFDDSPPTPSNSNRRPSY